MFGSSTGKASVVTLIATMGHRGEALKINDLSQKKQKSESSAPLKQQNLTNEPEEPFDGRSIVQEKYFRDKLKLQKSIESLLGKLSMTKADAMQRLKAHLEGVLSHGNTQFTEKDFDKINVAALEKIEEHLKKLEDPNFEKKWIPKSLDKYDVMEKKMCELALQWVKDCEKVEEDSDMEKRLLWGGEPEQGPCAVRVAQGQRHTCNFLSIFSALSRSPVEGDVNLLENSVSLIRNDRSILVWVNASYIKNSPKYNAKANADEGYCKWDLGKMGIFESVNEGGKKRGFVTIEVDQLIDERRAFNSLENKTNSLALAAMVRVMMEFSYRGRGTPMSHVKAWVRHNTSVNNGVKFMHEADTYLERNLFSNIDSTENSHFGYVSGLAHFFDWEKLHSTTWNFRMSEKQRTTLVKEHADYPMTLFTSHANFKTFETKNGAQLWGEPHRSGDCGSSAEECIVRFNRTFPGKDQSVDECVICVFSTCAKFQKKRKLFKRSMMIKFSKETDHLEGHSNKAPHTDVRLRRSHWVIKHGQEKDLGTSLRSALQLRRIGKIWKEIEKTGRHEVYTGEEYHY